MTILPSGSLEITSVNIGDRAGYRCSAGSITSRQADLKLKALVSNAEPEPPTFLVTPTSKAVLVGGEVTLECSANGLPQPSLTWLKDGRQLEMSHLDTRYSKTGQGSLTIRRVELGDEGGYQCRAENTEDSLDAGVELTVMVAPGFKKKPVSFVSYEKDDILFDCEVTGRPEPVVQWFKNGDLIIQSEYFQVLLRSAAQTSQFSHSQHVSDGSWHQPQDPGLGEQRCRDLPVHCHQPGGRYPGSSSATSQV